MKKTLREIKAAMETLEKFPKRYADLEAKGTQLKASIATLKAEVVVGEGKAVNQLGIARERLEALPDEVKAVKEEEQSVVDELHGLITGLGPDVAREYVRELGRMEAVAEEFLGKHVESEYVRGTMAKEIAKEFRTVKKLDLMRQVFGTGLRFNRITLDTLLGNARYALENLKDVV